MKDRDMPHKFAVGQSVEYKPAGASVSLFRVVRQMPEEFHAIDRKYRIKCEHESFERNVLECDLSPAGKDPREYWPPALIRRTDRN